LTIAPLSSTIVSLGLIPVAFFFVHAFYSGVKHKKFHAVSGLIAIIWDLSLSIGYMLYRTFGGVVEGASLQSSAHNGYFAVHGAVAVVVMVFEIVVLATGVRQLQTRKKLVLHSKLSKILFGIWWIAFFSGEIFYIVMYVL
jgi:hypothetical protein